MRFSLIIGTLNRSECLKYCLDSLKKQTFRDFEIIIVDQSDNDETELLLNQYSDLSIKYRRVFFKGLSKARNVALNLIEGEYFCLIDDDAFYDSNYLKLLDDCITRDNGERIIYSGYIWDTIRHRDFASYGELEDKQRLSVRDIIRNAPSPGLSFPIDIVSSVGFFDENFGVGATYGAAEETDYILRALKEGYNVYYYKDLYIEHPHKLLECDKYFDSKKVFQYAYGTGAMFCKHFQLGTKRILIPYIEKKYKPLIKILLNMQNARFEYKGFKKGFHDYNKGNRK